MRVTVQRATLWPFVRGFGYIIGIPLFAILLTWRFSSREGIVPYWVCGTDVFLMGRMQVAFVFTVERWLEWFEQRKENR